MSSEIQAIISKRNNTSMNSPNKKRGPPSPDKTKTPARKKINSAAPSPNDPPSEKKRGRSAMSLGSQELVSSFGNAIIHSPSRQQGGINKSNDDPTNESPSNDAITPDSNDARAPIPHEMVSTSVEDKQEKTHFVYVVQHTYQRLEDQFFGWDITYPTRIFGVYASMMDANNWATKLWDDHRNSPIWVPGGWGGHGMHVQHGEDQDGCLWWQTISGADSDQKLGWVKVEKCCINGPSSNMQRVWIDPVIGSLPRP
jgi:hypothetical protein